jgi:Effector-associated domain 1
MALDTNQRKRLYKALEEGFPTYFDLRKLLADIEWPDKKQYRLENIAAEDGGQDRVRFELVEWAEKHGLTEYLVKGAAAERPRLSVLVELLKEWYGLGGGGIDALLRLQRDFLAQPMYINNLLVPLRGIIATLLLVLASTIAGGFFLLVTWLAALCGIVDPPEWLKTVAGIVGLVLAMFVLVWPTEILNRLIPRVDTWSTNLYIRFFHAPRLARIALESGIEKSHAIKAYESYFGSVGIKVFTSRFDRLNDRKKEGVTDRPRSRN